MLQTHVAPHDTAHAPPQTVQLSPTNQTEEEIYVKLFDATAPLSTYQVDELMTIHDATTPSKTNDILHGNILRLNCSVNHGNKTPFKSSSQNNTNNSPYALSLHPVPANSNVITSIEDTLEPSTSQS